MTLRQRYSHFLLTATVLGRLLSLASPTAFSEPMELFTFEDKADLRHWSFSSKGKNPSKINLSSEFATRQSHSLELFAPTWVPGANEWPLWRMDRHFPHDWSRYDRILIDIVNPTHATTLLGLKAADGATSTLPTGNWRGIKVTIPAYGHLRVVQPLSEFLKGLLVSRMDQSDIRSFLLYATRPTSDFHLYISSITLLEPGDPLPEVSASYRASLRSLRLDPLLEKARIAMKTADGSGNIAKAQAAEWRGQLDRLQKKASDPDLSDREVERLAGELQSLTYAINRAESLAPWHEKAEREKAGYATAWAPSTVKILPREMPLKELDSREEAEISVARRETESIQMVVVPFQEKLVNARLEIGPFSNTDGLSLSKKSIEWSPVGYVKTERPAYEVDYIGWWPDPLLSFMTSVDIAPLDAQSFWIKIRPGEKQAAGLYRGTVRIVSDNAPPQTRSLTVRVRNFSVPQLPPIPVVFPAGSPTFFGGFTDEPWENLKLKVADFQADYYIGWDNLYIKQAPDWDIIERLQKQNRLGQFNLYPLPFGSNERKVVESGEYAPRLETLIATVQPIYEEAKRRNLLSHAYLYGLDELPTLYAPALKEISLRLKQSFPDIPIATTSPAYHASVEKKLDAIDIWVPLIHDYTPEEAARVRANGKQVWWYNCKTPAHPYPNQFTEYPAIELRLMHGAMSALYRPDGFLYYSLFRSWSLAGKPARKALNSGPFTDWDPCAMAFSPSELYNGEGYLAYPGPNGTPLSSIRLENFRDGLEDLWYWKLLTQKVTQLKNQPDAPATHGRWLKEAEEALQIPQALVKSHHEFSLESDRLYAWRNKMADLLETAPGSSTIQ